MESNDNGAKEVCAFCKRGDENPTAFGKLMTNQATSVHYFCMLFSCNLRQRGKDNAGIMGFLISDIKKELSRGARLRCVYCKKNGATIGCNIKKCAKSFHFPCGYENNTLHQYFGHFCSFCLSHRPKQAVPPLMDLDELASSGAPCPICLNAIDVRSTTETILSPCCKNACFHRACVQAQALNAGYFFKCPLCNDKDKYQTEMMMAGIYIPEQDASWELEENAFQDLLFRHNRCDHPTCVCPKGSEFNEDGSRWEIILCNTCGSQGCHIGCEKMSFFKPRWECSSCIEIRAPPVKKVAKKNSSTKRKSRRPLFRSGASQPQPGTSIQPTPATSQAATNTIAERINRHLRNTRSSLSTDAAASSSSLGESATDRSSPIVFVDLTGNDTSQNEESDTDDGGAYDRVNAVAVSDSDTDDVDVTGIKERNRLIDDDSDVEIDVGGCEANFIAETKLSKPETLSKGAVPHSKSPVKRSSEVARLASWNDDQHQIIDSGSRRASTAVQNRGTTTSVRNRETTTSAAADESVIILDDDCSDTLVRSEYGSKLAATFGCSAPTTRAKSRHRSLPRKRNGLSLYSSTIKRRYVNEEEKSQTKRAADCSLLDDECDGGQSAVGGQANVEKLVLPSSCRCPSEGEGEGTFSLILTIPSHSRPLSQLKIVPSA